MERQIAYTHKGYRADIGDSKIYRLLPNSNNQTIGAFVFLDYFPPLVIKPSKPHGPNRNGAHPHRGIATFTYLVNGEFEHYDSRGNYGIVTDGGAQWMKAGNGIIHNENFSQPFQERGGPLLGVQFWVNLPSAAKKELPEYLPVQDAEFPKIQLSGEAGFLKILIGNYQGNTSIVKSYVDQFLFHLRLESGKSYSPEIQHGVECAALSLNGPAVINANKQLQGDLAVFEPGNGNVTFKNDTDKILDILIFGGKPYDEPIVAQGPFVMNDHEGIAQAYHEYNTGKYGQIDYEISNRMPELRTKVQQ